MIGLVGQQDFSIGIIDRNYQWSRRIE